MLQSDVRELIQAAIAHHQAGRLQEAETLYRGILARIPQHPDALHMLGLLAFHAGQHDAAVELISQAIRVAPNHAACYSNLGNVFQARGLFAEAITSHRRALEIDPENAEGHYNLANVYCANGQLEEAVASYRRAVAIRPDHAPTHNNLASALQALGRLDEAQCGFRRALEIQPDYAEALRNMGLLLAERHQTEEAIQEIRKALAARPDYAEAWQSLGTQHEERGEIDEALACYDRAVELRPDFAAAHNNRGNALLAMGRLDESQASFERALAIEPDFAQAHGNLGILWQARGDLGRALDCHDRMLRLDPASADAHWNKALALLQEGDFAAGWPLYEWRWKFDDPRLVPRNFAKPLWLGDSALDGRTVLIHHEQGLGDTMQMLRYVPLLAQRGARVLTQVPPSLVGIASTVPGLAAVIPEGAPLPDFDIHCPFMSLPLALGTTIESIPGRVPYLFAPDLARHAWQERLGPASRRRIGLVWSGSRTHRNDRQRSIALRRLLPVLDTDAEFISVQKEYRPTDRQLMVADGRIRDWAEQLGDFSDTAGLLDHLDLLITVDTSVAHLAGAMGKPVWLLLPCASDFRWLRARDDSPWYPTMRLFRQRAFGDWDAVVEDIQALLR